MSLTNSAGEIVWQSAPADEVQVEILSEGYEPQPGVTLKATSDVQTITLTPKK